MDQSFLASSVAVTDTAGNVAYAAADGAIFLNMSADADNDLGIEMISTGEDPYDGPVGFEVKGVDLNDAVSLNIGLASGDGSSSITLSVDPNELGLAGLGLLGRGVDAADTLSGLVATLDGLPTGSAGTDEAFGAIEADLGIEAGTLRTLSGLTRDDVADAMQAVGIDHRLEELVRYATPEELQGLAETVNQDAEVQALIDQGGSLLTLPQVIGVVNTLGFDYSQINSLVSVDPDAVRTSAETGSIFCALVNGLNVWLRRPRRRADPRPPLGRHRA